MRRLAFPILAVGSLAVCCAVVTLWVRSYWTADGITHVRHDGAATPALYSGRALASRHGEIALRVTTIRTNDPFVRSHLKNVAATTAGFAYQKDMPKSFVGGAGAGDGRRFGVRWSPTRPVPMTSSNRMSVTITEIGVPHALVALPFAILPAVWLAWRLRPLERRRRARGLCIKCGYDLRASGDRCPECGEPRRPSLLPAGGYNST